MDKEIAAFGANILVKETTPDGKVKQGGPQSEWFTTEDEGEKSYSMGVVESIGELIEVVAGDLGLGQTVVFLKEKAKKVGLGFPGDLVVISAEDIVATIK